MSTTKPINQARPVLWHTVKFGTLAAGVLIPKGTFAMNDAGEAKPLTAAGMQGGATFLGVASDTYDNSAGGAAKATPMNFEKGLPVFVPKGKSGDLPAAANVGGKIALDQNDQVKATISGTDAQADLLEILPSSGGYRVLI